jgi:hypothetical protein
MSVFQQIVDVSGTAAFPSTPQVQIPFEPLSIGIINQDPTPSDDIILSFDGKNDHAQVFGADGVTFHQRTTKIWLRRGSVGTPPTNVQVIAES